MVTSDRWRVTPSRFRIIAVVNLVSLVLIVLTGAAVRLTGSGLGCPDWPTCVAGRVTAPVRYHAVIEYGNRMITGLLLLVTAVAVLAAWRRVPRRRDLLALTGSLVGGIVADAILGGFVVYTKLNPWLVSLHMVISLALVATGALTVHRASHRYDPDAPMVVHDNRLRRAARLMWAPFVAVVLSGTTTTGAGPHAGNSQGQLVAQRLPIAFSDAATIHLAMASVFVAGTLALLVAAHRRRAAASVLTGVHRLAAASVLQGAIGVTQYVLHVPIALVELHILGAVALTIGMVQLNVRQTARAREPDVAPWRPPIRPARALSAAAPRD